MLFNHRSRICMSPEADPAGGAGAAAPTVADLQKQLTAANAALEEEKKKSASAGKGAGGNADSASDLAEKARVAREAAAKAGEQSADIEIAVSFNHSLKDFVKTNEGLIPDEFAELLAVAEKETYASAVGKAKAIKSSLIKSYFAIQANMDLLTASQKKQVENYLKLTQAEREDKASSVFESVFEPTLEAVRRIKKAEQVALTRTGVTSGSDKDKAYLKRLIDGSKKTHLIGGAK